MSQTTTKNYSSANFSELVSDLQSAYNWYSTEIAEDVSYANFYVTENISVKFSLSGTALKFEIIKSNTSIASQQATYFLTKTVKTTKTFCFTVTTSTSSANISPTGTTLYHIVIGTAVNQLTGAKETGLAFIVNSTGSNPISGYIISSDNLTEPISANVFPCYNSNFNSKITSMQNFFYKNSECVMKDVYILLASQLSSFVFSDCTLNGKKYYMNSGILLADD